MRNTRRRRLEIAECMLRDVLRDWLRLEEVDLPTEQSLLDGGARGVYRLLKADASGGDEDERFRHAHVLYAALATRARLWHEARQALLVAQHMHERAPEWLRLAQLEHQRRDHAAAISATRRAACTANESGELVASGLGALHIGHYQLAVALFTAVTERFHDPIACLGRAVAAYRVGDHEDSARWLTEGERRLCIEVQPPLECSAGALVPLRAG